MHPMNPNQIVRKAMECGVVIPAFNIPYLPMVEPTVRAVADENSVAMIQVARIEWEKLSSGSLQAVAKEYHKHQDPAHTLLHLDHIPVIDEDNQPVDYMDYIRQGLDAGYQSVMVDASRLDLEGNIAATRQVTQLAHQSGVSVEAELGAVMGHESGPMMPYEEIFATKKGFTDLSEAKRFAAESGCDWLSVAVGNIHGAVAESLRHQKKPEARLDIAHVRALAQATGVPLVLHGGSGVKREFLLEGFKAGIAKINVATEIRQAYENNLDAGIPKAQDAVYQRTRELISRLYNIQNTADIVR